MKIRYIARSCDYRNPYFDEDDDLVVSLPQESSFDPHLRRSIIASEHIKASGFLNRRKTQEAMERICSRSLGDFN